MGGAPPPVTADKYSALAELESTFNIPPAATPPSVNWDSMVANQNATSSWLAASTSGSVFGIPAGGGVPAPSGFVYGGVLPPTGAPATGFNVPAGLTLLSSVVATI